MRNIMISKHRLITGLIVAVWLCLTLFLLGIFGTHSGWPAFLVLMFFTLAGGKTQVLKPIFIGGTVGLLIAKVLIIGVDVLIPRGVGAQVAIYIMVFITVFLLVILEDLSHTLFNSYSFAYFTVALVPKEQATVEWLIALYLGGAFFTGGVIILSKSYGKWQARKLENKGKINA